MFFFSCERMCFTANMSKVGHEVRETRNTNDFYPIKATTRR